MSGGIFISYRRADSRHAAGRLADELSAAFGEANIFRDIEGIALGVNFEQALEKALGACEVMLVLIGPNWLDARDDAGRRRLDRHDDWTRQEVATALKRGIPVVPVLLEATLLPTADKLPPDLQELASRQQFELTDAHWRGDVALLIDKLARIPGLKRLTPARGADAATPRPRRWGWWVAGGAVALAAGILSELDFGSGNGVMYDPAPATPVGGGRLPAQPVDNPVADAPVPDIPNLAGLWRTASGETYHFEQEGRLVRFTAEANGQDIGGGSGELEGKLLRLQMSMQLNGVFLGNILCNMQGTPDMRGFTGVCVGPRGQFGATMFR